MTGLLRRTVVVTEKHLSSGSKRLGQKGSKRKVVLVDPALRDSRGHHFLTLRKFAEHFSAADVHFAVHKDCSKDIELPSTKVHRVFPVSIYEVWKTRFRRPRRELLKEWLNDRVRLDKHEHRFLAGIIIDRLIGLALKARNHLRTSKLRWFVYLLVLLLAIPLSPLLLAVWLVRKLSRKRPPAWAPAPSVYLETLRRLIADLNLGPNDHIVIPTTEPELASASLWLLTVGAPQKLPYFHLRFMYTNETFLTNHYNYEGLYKRLRASQLLNTRLFVYTETQRHARSIAKYLGHTPPHVAYPVDRATPEDALPYADVSPSSPLVVGYLGDAREDKGFDKVLEIVRSFNARHPKHREHVRFVVQAFGNSPEQARLATDFRMSLLRSDSSIEVIPRHLSSKEYAELMGRIGMFLLPYDPKLYRVRGSGLVAEAVINARPFLATSGSSLEEFNTHGNAVFGETPSDMADAVADAVSRYPELQRAANSAAEHLQQLITNNALGEQVNKLLERDSSFSVPRRALFIAPYFPKGGSESTFKTYLTTFREFGFQTTALYIETSSMPHGRYSKYVRETQQYLHRATDGLGDCALSFSCYFPFGLIARLVRPFAAVVFDRSLELTHRFRSWRDLPPFVVAAARRGDYDLVFVNHVENESLLKKLQPAPSTRVVMDAHDLQSLQYPLRRDRGGRYFTSELEFECQRLATADAVVFPSVPEMGAFLEQRPDAKNKTFCLFPPNAHERDHSRVQSGNLEIDWEGDPYAPWRDDFDTHDIIQHAETEWTIERELESLDFLFMGSRHATNEAALDMLLYEVLDDETLKDRNLVLAGNVVESFFPEYKHPNVHPTHFATHLEPLYSSARLIVFPAPHWAGYATKVAAAMSRRKAILVSPSVMSSFGVKDITLLPFVAQNAAEFRQKMQEASASIERRIELADAAYDFYKKHCSPSRFAQRFRKMMNSVEISGLKAVALSDAVPPYLEHNANLNSYLRDLAAGKMPPRSMRSPDFEKWFSANSAMNWPKPRYVASRVLHPVPTNGVADTRRAASKAPGAPPRKKGRNPAARSRYRPSTDRR